MTRDSIVCKARSMTKQIPLDFCVPNPAHPACKECTSPKIDQLKPEDQARLRSPDASGGFYDDDLLDEPEGIEPPEEDFEEFTEE